VEYYDTEISFIEGLTKDARRSLAYVRDAETMRYTHVDSTEGMATLLKGAPLTLVLQERDAQFNWIAPNNSLAIIQIRRQTPFISSQGAMKTFRMIDRGDVRLTLDVASGRIERIAMLRPGTDSVETAIVPSEYRAFPGAIQLPQKIAVTNYSAGRVVTKDEFTLLSAKFNAEIDPDFLQGSLFSHRTRVTDYRLDKRGIIYFANDRPVSLNTLHLRKLRDKTRQFLPYALAFQVPLITAIILRRWKNARERLSA
jgi:hypothetical protein